MPSMVGCTVLGTQPSTSPCVSLASRCSVYLFPCVVFSSILYQRTETSGAVPAPRAADSALCSGGCSLKWAASLQAWLSAPGMLLSQGHTEDMPVWTAGGPYMAIVSLSAFFWVSLVVLAFWEATPVSSQLGLHSV